MGDGSFHVGDRVLISAGPFAAMPGTIISATEVATRWPDQLPQADVDRGVACWVCVRIYGREVPVVVPATDLTIA
jgi:transcription antitermination factor NusG